MTLHTHRKHPPNLFAIKCWQSNELPHLIRTRLLISRGGSRAPRRCGNGPWQRIFGIDSERNVGPSRYVVSTRWPISGQLIQNIFIDEAKIDRILVVVRSWILSGIRFSCPEICLTFHRGRKHHVAMGNKIRNLEVPRNYEPPWFRRNTAISSSSSK